MLVSSPQLNSLPFQILQPLAIAVIGSLAVAMMFSLVVTPTVYAMLHRENVEEKVRETL